MEGIRSYRCIICGYIYDPAVGEPQRGIRANTPFEELPLDHLCPICRAPVHERSSLPIEDHGRRCGIDRLYGKMI